MNLRKFISSEFRYIGSLEFSEHLKKQRRFLLSIATILMCFYLLDVSISDSWTIYGSTIHIGNLFTLPIVLNLLLLYQLFQFNNEFLREVNIKAKKYEQEFLKETDTEEKNIYNLNMFMNQIIMDLINLDQLFFELIQSNSIDLSKLSTEVLDERSKLVKKIGRIKQIGIGVNKNVLAFLAISAEFASQVVFDGGKLTSKALSDSFMFRYTKIEIHKLVSSKSLNLIFINQFNGKTRNASSLLDYWIPLVFSLLVFAYGYLQLIQILEF